MIMIMRNESLFNQILRKIIIKFTLNARFDNNDNNNNNTLTG